MTAPTIDDIKGWTILEKMRDGFTKICNYLKGVPTTEEVNILVAKKVPEIVEPIVGPIIATVDDLNTHMTTVDSDILTLKNKDNILSNSINEILNKMLINNNPPTNEGFIIEGTKPSMSLCGLETIVEGNTTKIQLDENADFALNERIPTMDNTITHLQNNKIGIVNNKANRTHLKIIGTGGLVETTTQDANITTVTMDLSTPTKILINEIALLPQLKTNLNSDKLKAVNARDVIFYRGTINTGGSSSATFFSLEGVVSNVENIGTDFRINMTGSIFIVENGVTKLEKLSSIQVLNTNNITVTYAELNGSLRWFNCDSCNGYIIHNRNTL